MSAKTKYHLLFLDLETTGHDPLRLVNDTLVPWHEIIDIGAVAASSKTLEVIGDFETKVMPQYTERCLPNLINHFPKRSEAGEWESASGLKDALNALFSFCEGTRGACVLVGQNFFFDWSFLSVAFAQCGITEEIWSEYFHYSKLDTRSMAVQQFTVPGMEYDPKRFSLRSGMLQENLNLPAEPEPHTAINGAYQAYNVYKELHQKKAR